MFIFDNHVLAVSMVFEKY